MDIPKLIIHSNGHPYLNNVPGIENVWDMVYYEDFEKIFNLHINILCLNVVKNILISRN